MSAYSSLTGLSRERSVAAAVSAFLLSLVLVGLVRRYAASLALVDLPNDRSSHAVPTPRGGGAGAVVAALIAILAYHTGLDWRLMLALLSVLLTTAVGWFDDRNDAPVSARLAAHLIAGVCLVPLAAGASPPSLLPLLALFAGWTFVTVAAINVANFMDGIDGLIGLQIVILASHFALLSEPGSEARLFALVLLGCALGFLLWNWAPARIFLGDAGSGGLGVLGVIGGALVLRAGIQFIAVFLPLFPPFLDALATIVRRARAGERLTESHRSHLYQRLANGGWGHARVSLAYGLAAIAGSAVAITYTDGRLLMAAGLYGLVVFLVGAVLDSRYRPGRRIQGV